jgi:hypothetical protein
MDEETAEVRREAEAPVEALEARDREATTAVEVAIERLLNLKVLR